MVLTIWRRRGARRPIRAAQAVAQKIPASGPLARELEAARLECARALQYFDSVTDPELIDHAIYRVEAAERRFTYLLRRSRQDQLEENGAAGGKPQAK